MKALMTKMLIISIKLILPEIIIEKKRLKKSFYLKAGKIRKKQKINCLMINFLEKNILNILLKKINLNIIEMIVRLVIKRLFLIKILNSMYYLVKK